MCRCVGGEYLVVVIYQLEKSKLKTSIFFEFVSSGIPFASINFVSFHIIDDWLNTRRLHSGTPSRKSEKGLLLFFCPKWGGKTPPHPPSVERRDTKCPVHTMKSRCAAQPATVCGCRAAYQSAKAVCEYDQQVKHYPEKRGTRPQWNPSSRQTRPLTGP